VRIAWFTAFSPRSGIAEFSRRVTPAIARHADVDIWTPDEPPLLATELPLFRFDAEADLESELAGYDVAVYSMGNTLRSHRPIHQVSQRHPGIVIVHDRVLHAMFVAGWWHDGGSIDPIYISRMGTYYGEEGARVASESVSGARPRIWENDDVADFPLVEEALQRALGAVTHSEGHARDLRTRWLGPVAALHHPAYADWLAAGALAGTSAPARADGRIQLTTVGHINRNKLCHRVINLLAEDAELAARTHYTIVGPRDDSNPYPSDLAALVDSVAPQVSAEMLGWRDDAELHALMAASDVFVNLRQPVIESASGSLILELAFGRPVLCFDDGAFGELPADCVARVPAGDFPAVGSALRRLAANADLRRLIGENARRVACEYTEAAYAEAFMEFVSDVRRTAPGLVLLDRVAAELGAAGADPATGVFERIAADFKPVLGL
jgi:glycosyltransferase involved in cell wall biosynthesis